MLQNSYFTEKYNWHRISMKRYFAPSFQNGGQKKVNNIVNWTSKHFTSVIFEKCYRIYIILVILYFTTFENKSVMIRLKNATRKLNLLLEDSVLLPSLGRARLPRWTESVTTRASLDALAPVLKLFWKILEFLCMYVYPVTRVAKSPVDNSVLFRGIWLWV